MVLRRQDRRGLTTLLFTDIVNSSDVAVELGDRRWRRLQARHHAEVRKQLRRFGGREVDTAGDGFFATFESPTSGVRCAFAIVRGVRELGLNIRAGLHIGEVELTGEKVGGIAVTTAQRVESAAEPGQVLATDTIVHLVAGSGLEFAEVGVRELKGVPGRWELFSLNAVDGESIGSPLDPKQAAEQRLLASPVAAVPARRRKGWPAALAATVALTAVVLFLVIRRQPSEQPQAPNAGSDVHETVAVLSADSGEVLFRPKDVASSGQNGAQGTGGPIVLTAPAGRANQAFAWIFSGVLGFDFHLQQLDASGAVINTFGRLTTCGPPGCLAEVDGKLWFLAPWKAPSFPTGVSAKAIDLVTGKWAAPLLVTRNISIGDVHGMAVGDGALWIGDTANSMVDRLDLRTEHVRSYAVGGSVDDVAFGNGYLWVIDATGDTLRRITPANGSEKKLPLNQAGTLRSLDVGGGYVWVTDDIDGVVWRVDTDMSEPTSIPVGNRPYDAVYADGTVWVANYGDETVSKVDPVSKEVLSYPVGIQPRALAAANDTVWVVGDLPGSNTS